MPASREPAHGPDKPPQEPIGCGNTGTIRRHNPWGRWLIVCFELAHLEHADGAAALLHFLVHVLSKLGEAVAAHAHFGGEDRAGGAEHRERIGGILERREVVHFLLLKRIEQAPRPFGDRCRR